MKKHVLTFAALSASFLSSAAFASDGLIRDVACRNDQRTIVISGSLDVATLKESGQERKLKVVPQLRSGGRFQILVLKLVGLDGPGEETTLTDTFALENGPVPGYRSRSVGFGTSVIENFECGYVPVADSFTPGAADSPEMHLSCTLLKASESGYQIDIKPELVPGAGTARQVAWLSRYTMGKLSPLTSFAVDSEKTGFGRRFSAPGFSLIVPKQRDLSHVNGTAKFRLANGESASGRVFCSMEP